MAKFAIMGYGTLGSSLAYVADINAESIAAKAGEEISVKYIFSSFCAVLSRLTGLFCKLYHIQRENSSSMTIF